MCNRVTRRCLPLLFAAAAVGCNNEFNLPDTVNIGPVVLITAPQDEAVFGGFDTIEFRGTMVDDNGLDDLEFVSWYSDQDGELGEADRVFPDAQGNSYLAAQLSGGSHAITLEATDFGGLTASDSITVIVGATYTDPTAEILAPDNFDEFDVGDDVDFVGLVSDPNEAPDQLWVAWTWVDTTGGTPTLLAEGSPETNGTTSVEWVDVPPGNYQVQLLVEDSDGYEASAEIFIVVIDPNDLDGDGDGFTVNEGDCNDQDATIYPGAPELCDGKDNDCNLVVDDKDDDLDYHIDEACLAYDGGVYAVDDCDDSDQTVYGGAPELVDGKDNDCDGEYDENSYAYDDDGDCFCEGPSCTDGINPSCVSIEPGDCNDADPYTHPDARDDPDVTYYDDNCDGIDGDKELAVFVSTAGVNNTQCSFASPCRNIGHAIGVAGTRGLYQLYLRAGTYTEVVHPTSNLEVYGGYDATWDRAPVDLAGHESKILGTYYASDGQHLGVRARSVTGVLFADLHIQGPNASGTLSGKGKGSYAVNAVSASLTFERVRITGGRGAGGTNGTNGGNWNQSDRAADGSVGQNAYRLALGQCSVDRQYGGAGGNESCSLTWGDTTGGTGGTSGKADTSCCWGTCSAICGNCDDTAGLGGSNADYTWGTYGVGGAGGGTCTSDSPDAGYAGRVRNGSGGFGGDRDGSLVNYYWYAGSGSSGGLGYNGSGGGGGGGSGGCDNSVDADAVGAGGGGGAAGGCRSTNFGGGGGGGGGSFGIFGVSSTIAVYSSDFYRGEGGSGGTGGTGGAGQPGGQAGRGGYAT
ncbi:MAG: putative metal-binding motif-containing protein, partial [Deltaproteobacteria bacterium]|nr:putative metal-binding motif-containing protein [Deltaproteobacteria bacterium]